MSSDYMANPFKYLSKKDAIKHLSNELAGTFGSASGNEQGISVTVTNLIPKKRFKELTKKCGAYLSFKSSQHNPNTWYVWWAKGNPPYKGDNSQPLVELTFDGHDLTTGFFPVPLEHAGGILHFLFDIREEIERVEREEYKRILDKIKLNIPKEIAEVIKIEGGNITLSVIEKVWPFFVNRYFPREGVGKPSSGIRVFADTDKYLIYSEQINLVINKNIRQNVAEIWKGTLILKDLEHNEEFIIRLLQLIKDGVRP